MPPLGIERAAEAVNASVTATPVAPATRLAAGMVMDTSVGVGKVLMPPLGAPADTDVPATSVCTVMPLVEPTVAAPMVNPESVMLTAAPAPTLAPVQVITIELAPVTTVAAGSKVREGLVPTLVSVELAAKNPLG